MSIYVLTNLNALLFKATHEYLPCPDPEALEAFCAIVRESAEGPQLAAQVFADRIHSSNARIAMLTLTMLDRCMVRCSASFQSEVGKFRFLNEMIKLVSPKYFADRTSPEVRTRVLQLLHAWSIEYPKETKFKVAYDMLKNQGVIKETPPPLPPENMAPITRTRPRSTIFEDEEKSKLLQKLLQSKKPEDLQHANRLIKTMVKEEERRSEANSLRAQEVGAALDSAGLLRDMLEHESETSADEEQLIHELHASCVRFRPVLQRLAASETETENLDDILHASDILDEVFEKYRMYVIEKKAESQKLKQQESTQKINPLLDFAGVAIDKNDVPDKSRETSINVIDELGDLFSAETSTPSIVEPLKPVSLIKPSEEFDLIGDKNDKVKGWNELDSLGKQLLQQSMPENTKTHESFMNKTGRKLSMKELEKSSPKHKEDNTLDLDFFTNKPERQVNPLASAISLKDDDAMVDISTNCEGNVFVPKALNNNNDNYILCSDVNNSSVNNILDLELTAKNTTHDEVDKSKDEKNSTSDGGNNIKSYKSNQVKPLSNINVTLDSVKPSKVPPMTIFESEDGVQVLLHFCKDKPRSDVNVIVISTTSKNSFPIEDYKLQCVVPKGCKIRQLTPSGSSIPAYNPFLPPPAVTQVLLVARPLSLPQINLKFFITYTCREEMCSEMGEVAHLPLDDV